VTSKPPAATTVTRHVSCCRICEQLCGIVADVSEGQVVRIRDDILHPATAVPRANVISLDRKATHTRNRWHDNPAAFGLEQVADTAEREDHRDSTRLDHMDSSCITGSPQRGDPQPRSFA
jgi:hypothetical protein